MTKADIRRVKRANDIVAVINEVIPLQRREGKKNYFGFCPFGEHGENTVEFEVNPEKQISKCFHCGIGGDVIKFVQYYYKIPFRKAVLMLAKRAVIKINDGINEPSEDEINPRDLWTGVFVPDWLLRREELSQGAKLCYGRLCRFYNPNTGQCNPKHETLAKELGVSERMARVYINTLVEQKLIRIHRNFGPGKKNNYGFLRNKWIVEALTKKKRVTKTEMPEFDENDF